MATLLRHDKVIFEDQVVYTTGSAYFGCEFIRCTIVFKGFPLHMDGCTLTGCVWHIDFVLHDNELASAFRSLLDDMIVKALPSDKPGDPEPAAKMGF